MGKVNTSPAQTPNDEKLSNADIVSYGFGGVTASTYDKFKQFYHMSFLSDVVGVPIGIVGNWSTIMTIWDAINDLIIGALADRTRSRLGKYRPWLYIGSILLAIVGVMMFSIPSGLDIQGLTVYYIVILFAFSIVQTLFTIPWISLNSVLTPNDNQRNLLLSSRQLGGFVAVYGVNLFLMKLLAKFGGGADAWQKVAILISTVILVCGILCANGARKVDYQDSIPTPAKVSLPDQLKLIYKNRAVITSSLINGLINLSSGIATSLNIYFLRIVLGSTHPISITAMTGMVCSFVFIPLVPRMIRGFSKLKVLVAGCLLNVLPCVVCFIFSEQLLAGDFATNSGLMFLYIAIVTIGNLGFTLANAATLSLAVDVIDYTELRFGAPQPGFISAATSFLKKVCTSFSTLIVGAALAAVGYAKEAPITPEIQQTVLNLRVFAPIIIMVVTLIVIRCYPITKSYAVEMRKQLAEKRASQ